MKKKRFRPWVIITFSIICLIGTIYYSYQVIMWNLHVKENNKIQKEIEEKIKPVDDSFQVDFKLLKEKNPDTVGYIIVNNTNIRYVVVKGKDNEYYLNHNFEKKWNVAGWIFGDYHNKFDGSDKNLIIYGHNTKDNSMFDSLKNVLEENWYSNKDNHIVTLITEEKIYHYEVFSSYPIKPEKYYINTSFNNDEEFNNFVIKLKSRSIYDYGVQVTGNDKILTLSSCLGEGQRRVVLHARLIDE